MLREVINMTVISQVMPGEQAETTVLLAEAAG